jgi:heme exporter protein A
VTQTAARSIGIRFDDIEKRFGGLYALRHISLEIGAGQCVVFAGRNGSGKTTLLRIAANLVRPSHGTVRFFERESESSAPESVRPGFVAHATMVYDELTAEENLLLFARLLGVLECGARATSLLQEVGLLERRNSLVRTFSRGMRQRLAIARALLHEPAILLLDEPATGLDPPGIAWLAETLRSLRDSGRTILMSLHGESVISSLATRAVLLDAGSVVADTRTGATFRSILTFADA